MRKISGQMVSSKPVSLSRAAKLISRFAAVDNGSSPTVSLYLQRAAEAFDHLVHFHDSQRVAQRNLESNPQEEISRNGYEAKTLKSDDKKVKRKKSDGVDSKKKKKRVEELDS